jgi:hypothetical protein
VTDQQMPSEADMDEMTDDQAEVWLDRFYERSPEVFAAVEAVTSIASPLAGPVRLLREVVAVMARP